jgi:hypothetical protein
MPDDSPPRCAHDDVNPMTTEPGALVEAVARLAREPDLTDQVEDRALRRRTALREPEQDRLANNLASEAAHLRRHPEVEPRAARWAGDGNESAISRADVRKQRALVERVEPRAPPPPAGQEQRSGERRHPPPRRNHYRQHCETGREDRDVRGPVADEVGGREPEA